MQAGVWDPPAVLEVSDAGLGLSLLGLVLQPGDAGHTGGVCSGPTRHHAAPLPGART